MWLEADWHQISEIDLFNLRIYSVLNPRKGKCSSKKSDINRIEKYFSKAKVQSITEQRKP